MLIHANKHANIIKFFYFRFILSPKLKFVSIINDLLRHKERFKILKESGKWKEDSYEKEVLIV